ncbi:hypothetical protein HYE28_03075 [Mycoplasmopsis bovis]|nr:hypothetical protein [Mycoplasmopsis bovis]QQH23063.1 hypothetical protein HYE28_03075 [Mycoplasmopsis bovis]
MEGSLFAFSGSDGAGESLWVPESVRDVLEELDESGESLWVPDSVRDVFEELDELDSSMCLFLHLS